MHEIKKMILKRNSGVHSGVYSVCSSNKFVIEASMKKAKEEGFILLLEITPNQVNQYRGYSGMTPKDFVEYIKILCIDNNFPLEKIILGGDHLGPLVWKNEEEKEAMGKAKELVRQIVGAGFTKIHIDTTMKLKGDAKGPLSLDTTIRRGLELILVAEKYSIGKDLVYVVGSEVPIPGGVASSEDLHITNKEDFIETLNLYKKELKRKNLEDIFEKIIAVVVQPGVEFSKFSIREYNRKDSLDLTTSLKEFPKIVFEGHSTDYQNKNKLREMIEDGIAILKVGPALTFALRGAIMGLERIEQKLISKECSNFFENLKSEMEKNTTYWQEHYEEEDLGNLIENSFLDRPRYYLDRPKVKESTNILIKNLESIKIPIQLIKENFPIQYEKIIKGELKPTPKDIIVDKIANVLDDYIYAVSDKS